MNDLFHASTASLNRNIDRRQFLDRQQLLDGSRSQEMLDGPFGTVVDGTSVFVLSKTNKGEHLRSEEQMRASTTIYSSNRANKLFTLNGDYQKTYRQITGLLYIEEDEDFTRPTRFALDFTLDLLENANAELINRGKQFPRGTSSTNEKGGIHIFWQGKGASIQLEVPARESGLYYIHVIAGANSLMRRKVSAKALADTFAEHDLLGSQKLGNNATASATA